MSDLLQKFLDGEVALEGLSVEERMQVEDWQGLLADAAELRAVRAPAWIETRVMATLPEHARRPVLARLISWLAAPQPVRVRPIWLGLAGAAAALLLFIGRPTAPGISPTLDSPQAARQVANAQPSIIYVQFVLADRDAKSVSVAGDFNAWDVDSTLLSDTDGDGVWTGLVALRPGQHKYMFVVDGQRWVTDPEAEHYIDDDFGMRNAVVTVTPPGRSI